MMVWEVTDLTAGIPFAEPPLGDLRLQPPVLKTHLDVKTFDASNFGPACLQPVRTLLNTCQMSTDKTNHQGLSIPLASEDCLTINVFRPSNLPRNAKLPVVRLYDTNIYEHT